MEFIKSNPLIYHFTSAVLAVIYFYIFTVSYNFLGQFMPVNLDIYESFGSTAIGNAVINIIFAVILGLIPTLATLLLVHFIIKPNTSLYLAGFIVIYSMLATRAIYADPLSHLHTEHLVSYIGKYLGGLVVFLLLAYLLRFLKSKSKVAS